jgi:hypothetical protein
MITPSQGKVELMNAKNILTDNCPTRSVFATATLNQWLVISTAIKEDIENKSEALTTFLASIYPAGDAPYFKYHYNEDGKKYHQLPLNVIDLYQSYFCMGARLTIEQKNLLIQRENALITYIDSLKNSGRLPVDTDNISYSLEILTWISRCFGHKEDYDDNHIPKDMRKAVVDFHDNKSEGDDEYSRQPNILDVYNFVLENTKAKNHLSQHWLPAIQRVFTRYSNTAQKFSEQKQTDFNYALKLLKLLKSNVDETEIPILEAYLLNRSYSDMHILEMSLSKGSQSKIIEAILTAFNIRKTDSNRNQITDSSIKNIGAKLRIGSFRDWGDITEPQA